MGAAPLPSSGDGGLAATCTSDSGCQADLVCGYELLAGCAYLSFVFPPGYGQTALAGLVVAEQDFMLPITPSHCAAFAAIEPNVDAGH